MAICVSCECNVKKDVIVCSCGFYHCVPCVESIGFNCSSSKRRDLDDRDVKLDNFWN